MANERTSWTDPKTGREVRVGDTWQDAKPIYGHRYPLRHLKVAGFMIDRRSERVQAFTGDYYFKRRLIKGHLVNIQCSEFVKRFVLLSRAPGPAPADPNALKPCPFCGGEALIAGGTKGRKIACRDCFAPGPPANDEAEARRLWNARAEVTRG